MNIQQKGIASLENCLNSNKIPYELTGKHYPVNITSMKIAEIHFTVTTWENDDFFVLVNFINECMSMDMDMSELRKQLYMFSNIAYNIDDITACMELLRGIIAEDFMPYNYRKIGGLKLLKKYGIKEQIRGLKIDLQKLNFEIDLDFCYIKELTWSIYNLYKNIYDNTCQSLETLARVQKRLSQLAETIVKCGFEHKEYVKDSYQNSKSKLIVILANAMNQIKIAQNRFDDTYNKKINHQFTNTESAFLYKGYYITPCILESIINDAWKNCDKASQKEYLKRFYNNEKVNIKTIASDMLFDMFNNNNTDRLNMLDDLRLGNVQAV